MLKPDVVFFEEMLPEAAIDRAFDLCREARLLLVVGSSLEVYPVAGLPDRALAAGGRVPYREERSSQRSNMRRAFERISPAVPSSSSTSRGREPGPSTRSSEAA